MAMRDYPVQGVGACVTCFDWKDTKMCLTLDDENESFFSELQPNGVTAVIEFVRVGDGSNDNDDVYLITYNCKPYERTPFNSLDELKEFYVRALRNQVNNTEQEIREAVGDIDETYFG